FLQLEEAIDKLRSLNLDVLQEEELSTLEEDMIKAKNMGDQNQKAERLKSALIDYLKENKYTSESLYQLADKALNSNMLATDINKTLVLFADGFLEYLYNRRNELENSSDLITEYDYLLLAYGGLILNNRRALLSYDVDYKLVYKIVTEIKNKYNIQCTISTDKDLKKLSHEFKFKSAPFKSIMIK
ncbi:MAG: hypothetical protein WCQ47_06420, partial [bacterium]